MWTRHDHALLLLSAGTNLTYSRGPVFLVELLNKCSTKRDATDEAECLEPMTFWLALRSQLYLAAHGIRTGSSGDAGNGGILDQGGSGGSAGASSSGGGGGAAGDGGVEVAQVVKAQAKEVIQKELQGLLADNNRRLLLRHLESCQVGHASNTQGLLLCGATYRLFTTCHICHKHRLLPAKGLYLYCHSDYHTRLHPLLDNNG